MNAAFFDLLDDVSLAPTKTHSVSTTSAEDPWEKVTPADGAEPYYYNSITGDSSYDKPLKIEPKAMCARP